MSSSAALTPVDDGIDVGPQRVAAEVRALEHAAGVLTPQLREAVAAAAQYAAAAHAPATRLAYRKDRRHFEAWLEHVSAPFRVGPVIDAEDGRPLLVAEPVVVAAYLAAEAKAGRHPSTVTRRAAAIAYAHRLANEANPCDALTVVDVLRGLRATEGTAPRRQATPLSADMLAQITEPIASDLTGLRDRAILLFGFASALRRSELVAIDHRHLRFPPQGATLWVPSSKSDQQGKGVVVAIHHARERPALDPVTALRAWIGASDLTSGPVFVRFFRGPGDEPTIGKTGKRLSAQSVARIVKQRAQAVGLQADELSGHSLRRGFVTEANAAGASEADIAAVTRHRSVQTLRSYVEAADPFSRAAVVL